MARNEKAANNIQLFRGSRSRNTVAQAMLGTDCCGDGGVVIDTDKLAERVHFSNGLAHSNPTAANDKWIFPQDGLAATDAEVISHINEFGVGAQISVLVIPTYSFVTGVSVAVLGAEPGLTFQLITRNGLVLPTAKQIDVTVTAGADDCQVTREQAEGDITAPFGELGEDEIQIYKFAKDGDGEFSLEADEIILEVVTMPTENDGKVVGSFALRVAVNYEVINRAEI